MKHKQNNVQNTTNKHKSFRERLISVFLILHFLKGCHFYFRFLDTKKLPDVTYQEFTLENIKAHKPKEQSIKYPLKTWNNTSSINKRNKNKFDQVA